MLNIILQEIFPESVGADGEPREKKTSGQGFKNMMVKLGKGLAGTSDSTKKHSTGQIMVNPLYLKVSTLISSRLFLKCSTCRRIIIAQE